MVLNRQRRVRVALKPLQEFLFRIQHALGHRQQDVTVCLVSDTAMARLNRTFRGKAGSTDVLSFAAQGLPGREKPDARQSAGRTSRARYAPNGRPGAAPPAYLGDIAISPEAALRTAQGGRRGLTSELRILILHGMLHLAGYDHEADDGTMKRIERRLRRQFGLR